MLTYFEFEQGQKIPSHEHPHEQITFILEGKMQFRLGDEIKYLKAGEGVTVPSNMKHSVYALRPVKVVDAWNPVREDYVVS
jgi:quercetin dioxygenase-like cupin family protein